MVTVCQDRYLLDGARRAMCGWYVPGSYLHETLSISDESVIFTRKIRTTYFVAQRSVKYPTKFLWQQRRQGVKRRPKLFLDNKTTVQARVANLSRSGYQHLLMCWREESYLQSTHRVLQGEIFHKEKITRSQIFIYLSK